MYAKLFGSILDSSLWSEELHVRVLFVTMIAMADREGFVYAARPGLARRAQLSREQIDDALTKLGSPDPDSSDHIRNPESEGRRVEEVDGGWRLLNYPYYRNLKDADTRREQVRAAVLRHRAKTRQKRPPKPKSLAITDDYGGLPVITSNHGNPSEATPEADTPSLPTEETPLKGGMPIPRQPSRRRNGFIPPTVEEVNAYLAEHYPHSQITGSEFVAKYDGVGWVVGRNRSPMKSWKGVLYTWVSNEQRRLDEGN